MIKNVDFLKEDDKYKEYYSLTNYQKKCLAATNYWRVINGIDIIDVPKEDIEYYKYFDIRCYKLKKK